MGGDSRSERPAGRRGPARHDRGSVPRDAARGERIAMAQIIGAVATSHIPLIGKAIASGWQNEPAWKPFFDSYAPVHEWLRSVRPDVAIVVYNDHGLNFFLDKMPTFAIGAAREYTNADEGWGLPVVRAFPGDPELSWHVIDSLVANEFDITSCQEMSVDHGF